MIRLNEIRLPLEAAKEDILKEAARLLNINKSDILSLSVYKKSLDSQIGRAHV